MKKLLGNCKNVVLRRIYDNLYLCIVIGSCIFPLLYTMNNNYTSANSESEQAEQSEQAEIYPYNIEEEKIANEEAVNAVPTPLTTELATESTTELVTEEEKIEPVISAEGPSEEYYYNLTDEEKIMIAKVVYREAGSESLEGKVAVAATILNRYAWPTDEYGGNSIEAVITFPNQYAGISSVTQEDLDSIPECLVAVDLALRGWDPTRAVFPEGAKNFYNPDLISDEESAIREGIIEIEIGNHCFHNDFLNL